MHIVMYIHEGRSHRHASIPTQDGYVFGGFASVPWQISSEWYGDEKCFLFTLRPKMAVYLSTGLNNHYMYLQHGAKTLPNGLVCGSRMSFMNASRLYECE